MARREAAVDTRSNSGVFIPRLEPVEYRRHALQGGHRSPHGAIEAVFEVRDQEVFRIMSLATDHRVGKVRLAGFAHPTDVIEVQVRDEDVGEVARLEPEL